MSMGMAVVMLVTTMLVVVMVMVVTAMCMCSMIVRRMTMPGMSMAVAGIGAAFRIEWGFDLDHPRAEPLHHAFDDMIAADP